MEDKLGAILNNPQLMQQIMSMAQSLGDSPPVQPPPVQEPASSPVPDIDPAMITKMMSLAGKTGIDRNQQALLHALKPYLTEMRLKKLEKAMKAAKLASAASALLPKGSIPFLSGR